MKGFIKYSILSFKLKACSLRENLLQAASPPERNGSVRAGCKLQACDGFTLIEMIVAVGIFMFVIVIAIGSLIAVVGADRKAQAIEAVVDNLRFAIDDMSRSVRTGTGYDCFTTSNPTLYTSPQAPKDCASGGNYVVFLDQYNNIVAYWFDASCNNNQGCIKRYTATWNRSTGSWAAGAGYLPITSSEIFFTNILPYNPFYVIASTRGNGFQPKMTITLPAQITQGSALTVLYLQTTITQRIYNQ